MMATLSVPRDTGHVLARQLIAKHGADRYPNAHAQLLKCLEELGELAGAILKRPARGTQGDAAIRKEYADAGLALYALGTKLGLDLITEMAAVVDGETRTFGGPMEEQP
jgi:NTP pyrophosphatase (non-canonical NTP hydrolase)